MKQLIRSKLVKILRFFHLVEPIKKFKQDLLNFILPEKLGSKRYAKMQRREYERYTKTYEQSKEFCVGNFLEHENYPYEKYLLAKYSGSTDYALDFGCGMGRMINRLLKIFKQVDGADLMQANLDYAKRYLSEENHLSAARYNLFKTDGLGCKITVPYKYDFIFSTICLQHIAVHKIRRQILVDLCQLLKVGGQACLQMGFSWDNGVHWFDNQYGADATNAGLDVSIPDESHFPAIAEDLKAVGFSKVEFGVFPSPHQEPRNYHSHWLYIYLEK